MIALSKLRGRSEAIKGVQGRASGVLPIMKLLEDVFSYANQLGQRPGAGAAYLNVKTTRHDFFSKKSTNYEKTLEVVHLHDDDFMMEEELKIEI